MSKKETLCWACLNYARCSWAYGIPVKGWTATPIKIPYTHGDIDSFIVNTCPLYKENRRKEVTINEIGQIVGRSRFTISRYVKTKKGRRLLRVALKKKGYLLRIDEAPSRSGKMKRDYCVEKQRGGNESS